MDADTIIDRRKLKRKLTYWRIAAVLMLVALIGVVAAEIYPGKRDHIARISIRNIIVEDQDRDQALTEIMKDEHAKALIVRINSPGGTTMRRRTCTAFALGLPCDLPPRTRSRPLGRD